MIISVYMYLKMGKVASLVQADVCVVKDAPIGMSDVVPYWVRLVPKGTNLRLFKISFSTFWLVEPCS